MTSLTMTQIFKKRPDIKKEVLEKHPVTKAEYKCRVEKKTMNRLRENMAKKLYDKPEQ